MKLTAATAEKLALEPGKSETFFWDDAIKGFAIRIRATGERRYIFQFKIGGKTKRVTIGSTTAMTLADARKIASGYHADVRRGGDPSAEKRERIAQTADVFGALVDKFLEQYRGRESTVIEVTRHLRRYAAPLHSAPVNTIKLRDVAALLDKIVKDSGATTANRVRSSLSMTFVWGMQRGLVDNNPVIGTAKQAERSRDRVLSDDELRAIIRALNGDDFGAIVRLLILTGQRRSEIGDLRWDEVDLDRNLITLGAERTKNARQHCIPLAKSARAILAARPRGDGAVFYCQSWQYLKNQLDARCSVKNWTLHDLRRSAASGMASIGIAPHVIEAVLNHVSGAKAGVAGVYNRYDYRAEKADALARWDEHIALCA